MDNLIIVCLFVLDLFLLGDQFFDDVGKVFRQGFSDLGTGVFGGDTFDDLHQAVEGYFIPVFEVIFFPLHNL